MAEPVVKKTTFTRKPRKTVRIAETPNEPEQKQENPVVEKEKLKGTRVSVLSGKPVISTGHAFIDSAFGGGIGVGQIVDVQEDVNSTYYRAILSLFIAQGISLPVPQRIVILSENPSSFLPLPKPLHQNIHHDQSAPENQPLKIAWRYDNLLEKTDPSGNRREPFSSVFDMHKTMDLSEEKQKHIEMINIADLRSQFPSTEEPKLSSSEFFTHMLNLLKDRIDKAKQDFTVLRIVLHSFGSFAWLDQRSDSIEKEMLVFVHKLKGLLKNSSSVCMISFPQHLFNASVSERLQRFSDIACEFKSFLGESNTEVDPAFADYNGFFNVLKLGKSNSLSCHRPDTMSFVFSRKRHKFVVEVFALPPELTRTTESSSSQASAKLMCQPSPVKPSVIDF